MTDALELVGAIDTVADSLQRAGVLYFITGSVASSMHGEYRATNDVDVVAALSDADVSTFIADMARAFVADLGQAREAVATQSSFNLIHRASFLKVDVFPLLTAFDETAAKRAESVAMSGASAALRVAPREDILLAKSVGIAWAMKYPRCNGGISLDSLHSTGTRSTWCTSGNGRRYSALPICYASFSISRLGHERASDADWADARGLKCSRAGSRGQCKARSRPPLLSKPT